MNAWLDYVVIYVFIAYVLMHMPLSSRLREMGFAALNMGYSFYYFFYLSSPGSWPLFLLCVGMVMAFYFLLCFYNMYPGARNYTLALVAPIIWLVLVKFDITVAVVGVSYLTLRLAYLVYELRVKRIRLPSITRYLGFTFFPLTFLIGPISPYSYYESSLDNPSRKVTPLSTSLERIFFGMVKCYLLSPYFKTMSFSGLWFDGYYHGIGDFAIATACNYMFFYLNFAGACDIIIGAAGILNIRVKEDFDNPMISRNLKEFWNRSHITLAHFLRDIAFMPGVICLSRMTHGRYIHAITVGMIITIFLFMGIWHDVTVNFMILGLLHGVGLSIHYLYTLYLKTLPAKVQRFSDTIYMRVISTLITFSYVSFTSIFLIYGKGGVDKIFSLLVI